MTNHNSQMPGEIWAYIGGITENRYWTPYEKVGTQYIRKDLAVPQEVVLAVKQLEMVAQEARRDYANMAETFEKHGMMSSRREAIETAAYIAAMLKRHEKALAMLTGGKS